MWDLNPRPLVPETSALSTELIAPEIGPTADPKRPFHTTVTGKLQFFSGNLPGLPGGGIHAINADPCQSFFVIRIEIVIRS